MKRKTNIFNLNSENDTNFLTFSNYTEYLTGNFLSTDTKLYPSTFLCFNLNFEEEHTLDNFKKFLMCYYENKLAVLRNWCIIKQYKQEDYLDPLSYLIEAIQKFFNDTTIKPNYVSNIVEQDYKGTYSDSICIINLNDYACVSEYNLNESNGDFVTVTQNENEVLCGWTNSEIQSIYGTNNDIAAEFDNSNTYSLKPQIASYELENCTANDIEFNVIVPLFDVVNTKQFDNNTSDELLLTTKVDGCYNKNIPLGIWTNGEKIKLSRYNGFAQNWSLVIGSKFSPMPYGTINYINDINSFGNTVIDTVEVNNLADQQTLTYAQLLYKHNELYNKYQEALNDFNALKYQLEDIQTKLNQIPIESNFSQIREYVDEKTNNLAEEVEKAKEDIYERIANLKWKQS